jgi:membrane-associated phospholipid phosphatase
MLSASPSFRDAVRSGGRRSRQATPILPALLASVLVFPPCSDAAIAQEAIAAIADGTAAAVAPCRDANGDIAASDDATPEASAPGIGTIALKDAVYVLGSPFRWNGKDWLVFSGVAVGVVAVGFAADTWVRDTTQKHKNRALDDVTRVVEPFGAGYSYAVLGAYGVAGFVFHDAEARDIAVDGALASMLAGGIITPVLKTVIGRARPYQLQGTTSFHPFNSNDSSFPSGHATEAFAVASVISAHSDKLWVNISAYTLAGLVAFARIYHNAHWTSDVTAGALIGAGVGQGVVALNRKLRTGDGHAQIAFTLLANDRQRGAGMNILF